MRRAEIVKKYKNEWVLIEVKKIDEDYNLKEGNVIAHSKDKSEVYGRLLKLKGKEVYLDYTGQVPKDLAVVLYYEKNL
jgi:hypothetical protein